MKKIGEKFGSSIYYYLSLLLKECLLCIRSKTIIDLNPMLMAT